MTMDNNAAKTLDAKNESPIPTRKYLQCTYSATCQSSIGMEVPVGLNLNNIKLCCPICTDFRLTAIEAALQSLIGSASATSKATDTENSEGNLTPSQPSTENDTKSANTASGKDSEHVKPPQTGLNTDDKTGEHSGNTLAKNLRYTPGRVLPYEKLSRSASKDMSRLAVF